jgi:hypothetical protein
MLGCQDIYLEAAMLNLSAAVQLMACADMQHKRS